MYRFLSSFEGFKVSVPVLIVLFTFLAAGLVHFQPQPWITYGSLALGAVIIVSLALISAQGIKDMIQNNIQTARSITEQDYQASFSTVQDSGLLKQHQESLQGMLDHVKHELSLYKGLVHSMVTPYVVTDTNEVFILGNQALVDMLEHEGKPQDFYGQNVAMFFYGEKRQTVLGTAMQENRSISKEVELTGRKGSKRNINIDASPLYDIEGKLMGSLCIYTDLTEIRASEARIKEQNQTISHHASQAFQISEALATASTELASQVEQASRGAEEQNSLAGQAATSMEEMNKTVLEVARNASQAAQGSGQAKERAQNGAQTVQEAVQAIDTVQKNVLELKNQISLLSEQAEGIGKIMDVIEDIADQTNLLALNAAIEAARAGESGRGFAVVADEVRKLAEKTMNATKDVSQYISTIQEEVRKNTDSVDQTVESVKGATTKANESGEQLQDIVKLVQQATEQAQSIATATEEQSTASEEINSNIEEVNRISRETSEVLVQSSRAVSDLSQQAQKLKELVHQLQKG